MRTHRQLFTLFMLLYLFCSVAQAQQKPGPDLDKIRTEQTKLLGEVKAKKRPYDELSTKEREELINQQTRVLEAIKDKDAFHALSEADQLVVFNDLESIKATLTKAKDQRMVCRHERISGSNVTQKVCKTVAQMRKEREAAKAMLNNRPSSCSSDYIGCGDGG